jgi:Ca-activated chloride channel family protein
MFNITAYNNQYLRLQQNTMQAVLSISVDASANIPPAPLALGIALDHSGSMDGEKMDAARNGAARVVQALDETMTFMLVSFNHEARILFGPALGSTENKRRALQAIQSVYASGGTRMSTALTTIVDKLGQKRDWAAKILFLTDGKNEGERRPALNQAVEKCTAANISISAWGIGTDWDAAELRYIADATHGSADIIPTPQQVASAFAASFNEMRKTAFTNARLVLWSPVGVVVRQIQQVFPTIAPLDLQQDPASPRQQLVALGSFAPGDQREYLCDLEIPVYEPGQQFMILRPSMRYVSRLAGDQNEKGERTGWVFAQWTDNANLAAQIEAHIAHYTNQEELSQRINDGQAALAAGDRERATRLLGEALGISERLGNERITQLLNTVVLRDEKGTIRLNQQADAVAKKTLEINAGRTSKLK